MDKFNLEEDKKIYEGWARAGFPYVVVYFNDAGEKRDAASMSLKNAEDFIERHGLAYYKLYTSMKDFTEQIEDSEITFIEAKRIAQSGCDYGDENYIEFFESDEFEELDNYIGGVEQEIFEELSIEYSIQGLTMDISMQSGRGEFSLFGQGYLSIGWDYSELYRAERQAVLKSETREQLKAELKEFFDVKVMELKNSQD